MKAFYLGLLAFMACFFSLPSWAVISIDHALPVQKLAGSWSYCQTPKLLDMTNIEHCDFQSVKQSSLPSGFSNNTHWLNFSLSNNHDQAIERWMEVGHPRLQYVSLFKLEPSGQWHQVETGQSIPGHDRPISSQRLLLPIRLEPYEAAHYYLAVRSETRIDLSLSLWSLPRYFLKESRSQVVQALAMGGLLLTVVFCLIIFSQWRDLAMLWLALSFAAEILLDASYTGLLSAYFWPRGLAFDIHLHAIFAAATIFFFLWFVRSFLSTATHHPTMDGLIRLIGLAILLAAASSFFVGYGTAIRIIALLALVSMLLSNFLFYTAWRNGSGPAGYLLVGYLLLVSMIAYRTMIAFGWLAPLPLEVMGFSWYFLLIAPTTLIAATKRYDAIRQKLIRTESEREAYAYFLTSMSHELRSPVSRILLQVQALNAPSLNDKTRPILQAGQQLLAMIDDILDYARTRAGKITLSHDVFSLRALMISIIQETNPQAQASRNKLSSVIKDIGLNDWVIADERRLRQVLINLLSNAHRYCQDGQVVIQFEKLAEDESSLRLAFSVTDTGIGIAEEDMQRIFKPFERLRHSSSVHVDGSGVGLSVSQELVTLMGGKIHVTSLPSQGSCFRFELSLPKDQLASLHNQPQLTRPEGEALETLRDYIARGSVTDIQDWIELMQQQAPEHAIFYGHLSTALERLQLADLERLCTASALVTPQDCKNPSAPDYGHGG